MSGLLEQWRRSVYALEMCERDLQNGPDDPHYQENLDAREWLRAQVAELQERIDGGDLTDTESAEYLATVDDDPFDKNTEEAQGRRRILAHRVDDSLTDEWQPIGDLVFAVYGRAYSENSAQHAAVRKVVARKVWPHLYKLDTPPSAEVTLPADAIFGLVRLHA